MPKGGDTTTTSSTSSLPEEIKPYYEDLLKRAQGVSKQKYTPYGDERLAEFSPDSNNAFDMVRGIAGAGTPGIDAAMGTLGGLSNYQAGAIGAGAPVTTSDFNFKGTLDADLGAYMNPYTQNVLDVQKQRADRTFQEQQAGRDASAIAAGAFGGDRRFVADSLAQRDLNQQLQEMDATGLSAAFDRATGLFQTDEQRRLAAHEGDAGRRLQAQTGNADRGLSAAIANEDARLRGSSLGLDAALGMGTLEGQRRDLDLGAAEALSGVGAKIQQRDQAGLDMAYQDFINQRDWPSKQLSLYSQLLSGTPVNPSSTTTTTEPAPDFLSQLIGAGTGAAGIWKLLGL